MEEQQLDFVSVNSEVLVLKFHCCLFQGALVRLAPEAANQFQFSGSAIACERRSTNSDWIANVGQILRWSSPPLFNVKFSKIYLKLRQLYSRDFARAQHFHSTLGDYLEISPDTELGT